MKRVFAVLGAAVLGVAVMLAAAPSKAGTYTLNFNGTITSVIGSFNAGVVVGDPVSGTLTIDPFNDSTFSVDGLGNNGFNEASMSFTLHLPNATFVLPDWDGFGGGSISSGPTNDLRLAMVDANDQILGLAFDTTANTQLSTLVGLPDTPAGIVSALGGTVLQAAGIFGLHFGTTGSISFDLTTTVTPIPATLPLFASALGGLGLLGWRRRTSRERAMPAPMPVTVAQD